MLLMSLSQSSSSIFMRIWNSYRGGHSSTLWHPSNLILYLPEVLIMDEFDLYTFINAQTNLLTHSNAIHFLVMLNCIPKKR